MKSVKTNYILNLINTGTQIIFPLLTFPYASRIMEPDGIGTTNFFSSIISYITIFTCLGIPTYAVREVARHRSNPFNTNKITVEIILLHLLLTLIGYLAVGLLCISITDIKNNIPLFLILSSSILFTTLGCEWFYLGVEDFTYVTIRGIIVKLLSIVFLFIFVKTKDDILLYGIYTVFVTVGGNIFNFLRLKKHVNLKGINIKTINIKRHIKPTLSVFAFTVINSFFLLLNPLILGFSRNTTEVGYFTTSTKLLDILLKFSYCLGVVMMPRIANLIAENKIDEFRKLSLKAYNYTLATNIPLGICLFMLSPYLTKILAGELFTPSIESTQIISPIILLVGICNVIGYQILYPIGKLKIVIFSIGVGILIDIILNLLLISTMGYIGTSIAFLCAEISSTFTMIFLGKKILPFNLRNPNSLTYIYAGIIMIVIMFVIQDIVQTNDILMLILMGGIGILCYTCILILRKDEFVISILNWIKRSLK